MRQGDHEELTAEQARGGRTRHEVRYILWISLAAVVIAFAVLYGFFFNA